MKNKRIVILLRMKHLTEPFKTHGRRVNYFSPRLFLDELAQVELTKDHATITEWSLN